MRKLGGQNVVVTIGSASKIFPGMIHLNDTSCFLWKQLQEEKSKEDLIQALAAEYGIDEETAANGVEKFLSSFKDVDCIEQ